MNILKIRVKRLENMFKQNKIAKKSLADENNEVLYTDKNKEFEGKIVKNFHSFFLQNISHEIKTPLNGILGFSQLMVKNELPFEKVVEYSNIINFCGNQLLETFNNFIDIARIESGLIALDKRMFVLDELLTELHNLFEVKLTLDKNDYVELIYQHNANIKNVYTDREMLYKTLEHILNNAIQYTYSGEIKFGCHYVKKNNQLLFYIKDTGVGISKDKVDIVFEKFRQADESLRRLYKGTGLGLTIAKAYVTKLGGHIWLESEIDIGTNVYFTIPCNSSN